MTEELFHMEECAKEKQKTVKQHFVPQYLLRNFLNDEMKLHVYDLHNKRFFLRHQKRFVIKIIFTKQN